MNKNGSEHTLAHTFTSMKENKHMHTNELDWKQTHTCTHMNKKGSEHTREQI